MYREENTKKRLIVSPDVPRTFRRSSISLPRPIPQEHYASKMHSLDPRNGRAQPFHSVALPHLQQLAGRGRLRKSFQVVHVYSIVGCIMGCDMHSKRAGQTLKSNRTLLVELNRLIRRQNRLIEFLVRSMYCAKPRQTPAYRNHPSNADALSSRP